MSDKVKSGKIKNNIEIVSRQIQNRICIVRDLQVMTDMDLAELYQVETKVLNQAVKRNIERFPKEFMFQLSREEAEILWSQSVTSSSGHGGRRYLPFVFTEQGVAMLSAVLRSEVAVKISIQIMQAFVQMRKFLINNAQVFGRLDRLETKQLKHIAESDEKFNRIFNALESRDLQPKQGIFYDGQIFDAYILITDIIRSAKKSILLIDNYADDTVLQMLTKRNKGVKTCIYTRNITKALTQDLEKHNSQYEPIEIKLLKTSHDRFIIIDNKTIYHFGASLKDAGKRWFAFSKLDLSVKDLVDRL
jgi:phage regulator Rha-like protein